MKGTAMRGFWVFAAFVLAIAVARGGSSQAGEELTGIAKLACEARLCLSTGEAPAECSPALTYYYSLKGKTGAITAALRQAFLNKCPMVSQAPTLPTYTIDSENGLASVGGSGKQIIAVDNDGILVSLGYEGEDSESRIAACDVCGEADPGE